MILRGTRSRGEKHEEGSSKRQRGDNVSSFFDDDLIRIQTPYDDAIIVSMAITNYDVKRVLFDNGSFINILFCDTFS